jgi:acyl carrier protein
MNGDQLSELIANVLNIELKRVTDSLSMSDVESWDSLKHMELVVSIENGYDVQLSFDDIVAMKSVGDIRTVLRTYGKGDA